MSLAFFSSLENSLRNQWITIVGGSFHHHIEWATMSMSISRLWITSRTVCVMAVAAFAQCLKTPVLMLVESTKQSPEGATPHCPILLVSPLYQPVITRNIWFSVSIFGSSCLTIYMGCEWEVSPSTPIYLQGLWINRLRECKLSGFNLYNPYFTELMFLNFSLWRV